MEQFPIKFQVLLYSIFLQIYFEIRNFLRDSSHPGQCILFVALFAHVVLQLGKMWMESPSSIES